MIKVLILTFSLLIFIILKSFLDTLIFSIVSKRNLKFNLKSIFYEENIFLLLIFIDKYFAVFIYSILIIKNGGFSSLKLNIYNLGYKKALKISIYTIITNAIILILLFTYIKFISLNNIILLIFLGFLNYFIINIIPFPMFDMFNIMIFYANNFLVNLVSRLNNFSVLVTYLLMFVFDKYIYFELIKRLYLWIQ